MGQRDSFETTPACQFKVRLSQYVDFVCMKEARVMSSNDLDTNLSYEVLIHNDFHGTGQPLDLFLF